MERKRKWSGMKWGEKRRGLSRKGSGTDRKTGGNCNGMKLGRKKAGPVPEGVGPGPEREGGLEWNEAV